MSDNIELEDVVDINDSVEKRDASELVADCYTDLSKYVIKTRAYASVVDGMKAVYRRTIYASRIYKNKIKSVAIIGDSIKLHPHGDSSIEGVLDIMACKYSSFPLYDSKGNFGGLGCFTGDTMIPLVDGRSLSLKEIHEKFNNEEDPDLWVYSNDGSGKIYPRKILNSFNNGTKKIMEIELDNGEKIRCTLDHKFMLRDGSYLEAQDLREGISLMPLYRQINSRGYEEVYDESISDWVLTHRLDLSNVENYESLKGKGRRVVHHKDYDKRNNKPTNLLGMTWDDHKKLHSEICNRQLHTEEAMLKSKEGIKRYWDNLSHEEKIEIMSRRILSDESILKAQESRAKIINSTEYRAKLSKGLEEWWDSLSDEDRLIQLNKSILSEESKIKSHLRMKEDSDYRRDLLSRSILDPDVHEKSYANGLGKMTKEERSELGRRTGEKLAKENPEHFKEMSSKGGWRKFRDNNPELASEISRRNIEVAREYADKPGVKLRGRWRNIYGEVIRLFGEFNESNFNEFMKSKNKQARMRFSKLFNVYDSVDELRLDYESRYNHKVKSIRILDEEAEVYDIETDEFHNFALESGVFVHNSRAAAPRYTECCLSELGRLMCLELIDYAEMIDGEAGFPEPKYLPSLLPYCLLEGTAGIPVGMPSPSIPPLNAVDLVNYWISRLEGEENPKLPKIDCGNVILDCDYEEHLVPLLKTGEGRMWYRGLIVQEDENKFSISEGTPKCSIYKVADKLKWWIDEGIIDYIDETDSDGYRLVFTINDLNKMPADQFKNKLENIMKCTESYRFILEEDEKAVYCGIDYIYRKNIQYLTECTLRKFTDLSDKTMSKLVIFKAIRDFKESGNVEKMTNLSDKDVIDIIVGLGYEEWVAKAVLDKPIKYLNKSHDDDIRSLEKEYETNQYYLANPSKYLLELYYRLKDMIINMYSTRNHSILIDDLNNKKEYGAVLEDNEIIISEGNGQKWIKNLILMNPEGMMIKKFVSSNSETRITLDPDNDIKFIAGDRGKYVLAITDCYIAVKRLEEVQSGKYICNLWDGYKIEQMYVLNSEDAKLVDERSNIIDIHLKDYIRSRISNPIKCSRYKIKKVLIETE